MQIRLIGTGSILTDSISACALLDNTVMLDCPNGAVKAMRRLGIDVTKVDFCLITHFHGDHYFDIPFMLLEQGIRPIRDKDFVVIGPKGISSQIEQLFKLAYPEDWDVISKQSRLRTIEIDEEEKPICTGDYTIIPYRVNHSICDAYGYTISHGSKTVGFTGDSVFCSGIEKIIHSSDIAFVDMSFEKNTKTHMGFMDVDALINLYGKDKMILPIHMSDRVRDLFESRYFTPPADGDTFDIF